MKPAPFAWQRVDTLDEAIGSLRDAPEAKPIAGGQSLGPMLNLRLARPARLIDIRGVDELARIDASGDDVRIGACVTHARIEDEAAGIEGLKPLALVARGIAYRAVRNRGTLGGSLAHADPAADWPLVLSALGATLELRGPGGARRIPVSEFVTGPYSTALASAEILACIEVPRMRSKARWVYRKFCRKPGEFAEAAAAALFDPERLIAHVYLGAPAARPVALAALAAELARGGRSALQRVRLEDVIGPLVADAPPERRHAAGVVLGRVLEEALQ